MTKTTTKQKKQAQCLPAPPVPADASRPAQSDVDGIRKLDRSRPFGSISPPWFGARGKELDRAAFFEQDGRLFDVEDREIIPGQALAPKSPVAGEPQSDETHRLDRSRKFGSISPPWLGNKGTELDRPAFFEQDGRVFDRDGLEIVVGRGLPRKPAGPVTPELAPSGKPAPADWLAINSPAELFLRAEELPDRQLHARAEAIFATLARPCPATRGAIIEELMVTLGYSPQYAKVWHSHHENRQQKAT
jgi:hypothetical protein